LYTDETQKHILVLRKGHFFTFPVFDESGNILPPDTLYAYMSHITNMKLNDAEHPIGVLTSENRNTWARIRENLEKLGNQEALRLVDSAVYCIALDDLSSEDPDKLLTNFLHGDPKNRWFDKSISLIVTQNAQAAVNFEHSWGDGVAVLRFFTEIFSDTEKHRFVTTKSKVDSNADFGEIKKLEFKLDDGLISAINEAKSKYSEAVSRIKIKNFELNLFGKQFLKKLSVGPDSLMQTAFQVRKI
jgi:carnitine O-palmitoyltransferase 2